MQKFISILLSVLLLYSSSIPLFAQTLEQHLVQADRQARKNHTYI